MTRGKEAFVPMTSISLPAAGRRPIARRQRQWPRRTLVLLSAAVTAVTLLFIIGRAVLTPRPAGPKTGDGVVVFMTAFSVPKHVTITPAHVTPVRMPAADVPAGAITDPADFAGKVARETIPRYTILTAQHLVAATEVRGVAVQLPDGSQAVTILVPEVEAAAGQIVVGNRVNVLATFAQPSPITVWAAREAEVLQVARVDLPVPEQGRAGAPLARSAIGAAADAQPKVLALTLRARPDEVPTLLLGLHVGRLAVAILPAKGDAVASTSGASLAAIARALIPEERKADSNEPRSGFAQATLQPIRVAPAPTVPVLPPVPQAPARVKPPGPPAPPDRSEPTKPAAPEVQLVKIEVIRGADVRLEAVTADGQPPSDASVRTRATTKTQEPPVVVPSPPPLSPPEQPSQQSTGGGS